MGRFTVVIVGFVRRVGRVGREDPLSHFVTAPPTMLTHFGGASGKKRRSAPKAKLLGEVARSAERGLFLKPSGGALLGKNMVVYTKS